MWNKIARILKIILIFIGFSFAVTYVWYIAEKSALNNANAADLNGGEFLLYFLGYGDIQNVNLTFKLVYSIIGIMVLALLSSVFTVSLLEWKHRLSVSKNMIVWDNEAAEHFGTVLINNKHKDIYKLTLTMHLDSGNNVSFEERFFPYIPKDSKKLINYKIEVGSLLYTYLRNAIKYGYNETLSLIASYIDSSNGQEYVICNKYQLAKSKKENRIIFNNAIFKDLYDTAASQIDGKLDMKVFKRIAQTADDKYDAYLSEQIKNAGFSIDLRKTAPIRAENITISYGKTPATERDILNLTLENMNSSFITSRINFKDQKVEEPGDFGMALIKRPLGGDWLKYYDLNCIFTFDIFVSPGIVVSLELKDSKGSRIIDPMPQFYSKNSYESYTFKLKTIEREKWSDVDELCFTVFQRDTKINRGEFSVIGCQLLDPGK